jgi:hypothetical protein
VRCVFCVCMCVFGGGGVYIEVVSPPCCDMYTYMYSTHTHTHTHINVHTQADPTVLGPLLSDAQRFDCLEKGDVARVQSALKLTKHQVDKCWWGDTVGCILDVCARMMRAYIYIYSPPTRSPHG